MDVLAKKMSILAALIAMVVVIVVGGLSSLPWELVLMRGGTAFVLVIACSMLLFKLALRDRPRVDEKGEPKA